MDEPGLEEGRELGLKRGRVALRPYDPAWASAAAYEIEAVRAALEGAVLDVQHVGSTAVPGLLSKPIIDIAAAMRSPIDEDDVVRRLSRAGYVFRGDTGPEGGLLFVRTDENEVRTVHVHVVRADSTEWGHYLKFRDLLRQDRRTRETYEQVKREAAARFPDDRASYTAAKRGFIRHALADNGPLAERPNE
jgi:GrpB-like predicted nucleotidyltransferase (UPF0157 family)